jgi:GT2 family glycosyltransferase
MSVYKNDKIEYVKEALYSLYNQTSKADIFIKIDGEVNRDLEEFLLLEKQKGRIKYLLQSDKNRGLAASLNELIKKGLQEGYVYFFRMDADDISLPDRFKKQLAYLKMHPDIDVVGGAIEEFGEGIDYHKIVRYPLEHEAMRAYFAKRVPLPHPTAMFRARFFEKAGHYPIQSLTNEDTLMWMEGFAHGCRFANLPDVLVRMRVSPDFFGRRGGFSKAWNDFKDRLRVIRTLGYNITAYGYAVAVLGVNLAPPWLKKILYSRLR